MLQTSPRYIDLASFRRDTVAWLTRATFILLRVQNAGHAAKMLALGLCIAVLRKLLMLWTQGNAP